MVAFVFMSSFPDGNRKFAFTDRKSFGNKGSTVYIKVGSFSLIDITLCSG